MPRSTKLSEEVAAWVDRLEAADEVLRPELGVWNGTLRAYRGVFFPDEVDEDRRSGVNHILGVVSRLVPRLYYRDPNILVRPTGGTASDPVVVQGAKAIRAYLMNEFRRLEVSTEVRRCIIDMMVFNVGWYKLGYVSPFTDEGQEKDQIGVALAALEAEIPASKKQELLKKKKIRPEDISHDDRMRSGDIFGKRVHPYLVRRDPDATTQEDCQWMAVITPRRVEDVKNSNLYDKKAVEEIGAEKPPSDLMGMFFGEDDRKMRRFSDGWVFPTEIWDKRSGQVHVIARSAERPLREPRDWPYEMKGFPVLHLQTVTDPNKFYGKPPIANWLPQVRELTLYRWKRLQRIMKNNSKWLGDKQILDADVMEALSSDTDNDIAKVDLSDGKQLANIIQRIDPAVTPPDLGVAEARAKEDLSVLSGVTEQRRGVAGPYVTATEASIVAVATEDFEGDNLKTVSEFVQKIAVGFKSLGAQYRTTPEIVSTTGVTGFNVYQITPRLLKHDYTVEVVVGSSRFLSVEQELNALQGYAQLAINTWPHTDVMTLLRLIGDRLNLPVDPELIILNPDDPGDQDRLAMLAVARQLLGIQTPEPGGQQGQGGGGGSLSAMANGGIAGGVGGSPTNTLSPEEFASADVRQ